MDTKRYWRWESDIGRMTKVIGHGLNITGVQKDILRMAPSRATCFGLAQILHEDVLGRMTLLNS